MRKFTIICCAALFALSCLPKISAQDAPKNQETAKTPPPPAHYYRLEFVVQELGADGKPVNSRTYTGMLSNRQRVSVRVGSRIPVVTGSSSGGDNKVQYLDVGVNIDAREENELDNGMLALDLNAEVSSLAASSDVSQPSTPIIRQTRWQAPVIIAVRKPTVVFTSDDLDSKGSMQLVVTATPMQ
jgi:hypothetical protein